MMCEPCKKGGRALAAGQSQAEVAAYHAQCAALTREYPHPTWCDCAHKTEMPVPQPASRA